MFTYHNTKNTILTLLFFVTAVAQDADTTTVAEEGS